MRTEKKEIQKIEYVTTYIANDGTEFKSEEECKKYENTARCAINEMVKRIPRQDTYDSENNGLPYFGCDDTVTAFKIRSVDDVEAVNKWLLDLDPVNCKSLCLGTETVGTIQLFCLYNDGCDVWKLGSVEDLKNTYLKAIDSFVNTLIDKEGEES